MARERRSKHSHARQAQRRGVQQNCRCILASTLRILCIRHHVQKVIDAAPLTKRLFFFMGPEQNNAAAAKTLTSSVFLHRATISDNSLRTRVTASIYNVTHVMNRGTRKTHHRSFFVFSLNQQLSDLQILTRAPTHFFFFSKPTAVRLVNLTIVFLLSFFDFFAAVKRSLA